MVCISICPKLSSILFPFTATPKWGKKLNRKKCFHISSTKLTQKRVVEVCSEMFGILAILYWTGWGVPHLPDHVVAGRSLPYMARATCSKVINLIIKTVISNISSSAASSFSEVSTSSTLWPGQGPQWSRLWRSGRPPPPCPLRTAWRSTRSCPPEAGTFSSELDPEGTV